MIGFLCLLLSAVLIAGMVYVYGPKFMDYKKARDLYDGIEDTYTDDEPETELEGELSALLLNLDLYKKEGSGQDEAESNESVKSNPLKDFMPISVDGEGLLKENEDYIGWIYIPKTSISYPVVQSSDNADYLHTNFQKQYNYPGTIFCDCRCTKGLLNHHTVLYGHNMRDGSMFAGIRKFCDQEFLSEHPVFWLITPKYKLLYQIVSVCHADPYDKLIYGIDGIEFKNNDEWMEGIEKILERSEVDVDLIKVPDETSFFCTLSTCTENSGVRCTVTGMLLGELTGNFEDTENNTDGDVTEN